MKQQQFGVGGLILIVSLAVIGFAQAQDVNVAIESTNRAESTNTATGEETCFSLRQAKSMSALDDSHIFLQTSGNRNFLVSASSVCPGLKGAMGIEIRSREGDRVCGGGLASVTYSPGAGLPPRNCAVNSIISVADKAEAELIVGPGR
ncbi:MAG: DUF6491 family protein [Gammaproteobacteria bacterium]